MNETSRLKAGRRIAILSIVAAAVTVSAVALNLRINPRTEDAQVRANVVGVSPQIGGTIVALHVVDNQEVSRGDLLFELDPRPFAAEADRARAQLHLTELEIQADRDRIIAAEATLAEREARASYAASYLKRVSALLEKRYVTPDRVELAKSEADATASAVQEARASLAKARSLLGDIDGGNARKQASQAALDDALLKLAYSKVFAPCDGYVTNLQITPGAYAAVGQQVFSLVDRRIWFVLANFRETDLQRIRPGMEADIYLMAEPGRKRRGIVQGIPRAVYPLEAPSALSPSGEGLLSRVDPTIDFIQLAQRYPVRIIIDEPEAPSFRMGGTAAVIVHTARGVRKGAERLKSLQRTEKIPFESPAHE